MSNKQEKVAVSRQTLTILADEVAGRINHLFRGSCPDELDLETRDRGCLVCRALIEIEGELNKRSAS